MIRWRNGRPLVEVYDPALGEKRHVKPAEFDVSFKDLQGRALERAARRLEHAAEEAWATPVRTGPESCGEFARRWPDDFPGRGHRVRDAATVETNRQAVSKFADDFADTPLASLDRERAVKWAQKHPYRVPAVRAMFNDALDVGLVRGNPFANLGLAGSQGRKDILVLTPEEVTDLAETARRVHGDEFGEEIAAMIVWAAYTCVRAGELYSTRYSHLHGDTYDLTTQYSSLLRREKAPKYGSDGLIFVPQQARDALLAKPRRLEDDLCFRTVRGRQFSSPAWLYSWNDVRATFTANLPATHDLRRRQARNPKDKLDLHELRHFGASYMLNTLRLEPWVIAQQLRHQDGGKLVTSLYGHPSREEAITRIRGAYGENRVELRSVSGEHAGDAKAEGA